MAMDMFKRAAGIKLTHMPYKGSSSIIESGIAGFDASCSSRTSVGLFAARNASGSGITASIP